MSLTAIILAAGQSTRMKSRRPKPLHEICGRPMLEYILRACFAAGCGRVIVVVGYGKEQVIAQFGDDHRLTFVEQAEQRGTGHAVQVCAPELQKLHGEVLILAGDQPLVPGQALATLVRCHRDERAAASLATAVVDDPTGYGRIIRDAAGEFVEIREQVDCTPREQEIREVFPSLYCVRVEELLWALGRLQEHTSRQGRRELYLTDIFVHLRQAGKRVLAVQTLAADDVVAPNSRVELALADAVMQERIIRDLRTAGVTVVSSAHAYIEDGVAAGQDTIIYPFSFVGRDASIGPGCVIGPFAMVPRGAIVPEGSTIAGNLPPAELSLRS